jgi:hypothetical protein
MIGVLGFDSRRGLGSFLFTIVSRTALGLTQPPIQWVLGALPLGVKRPEREADHSPPSSAEVKECVELYLHSQYAFMAWCSVKSTGTTLPLPARQKQTVHYCCTLLTINTLHATNEIICSERPLCIVIVKMNSPASSWHSKKSMSFSFLPMTTMNYHGNVHKVQTYLI